jgi:hypothetical protein
MMTQVIVSVPLRVIKALYVFHNLKLRHRIEMNSSIKIIQKEGMKKEEEVFSSNVEF